MVDRIWQLMYVVAYRLLKCWWWLRRPHGRGAYVAVWVGNQILIIRNSYKRSFCVPAGGVDRGETYLEAAARELREESGIITDQDALETQGLADLFFDKCFVKRNGLSESII